MKSMKKDPQNLKVRVVMKPTAKAPQSRQYQYNWARVAIVAVPVLLLLGLLVAQFTGDEPGDPPRSDDMAIVSQSGEHLDNYDTRAATSTPEPEASPPPPAVEGTGETGDLASETAASQQSEQPQEPALSVEASSVEARTVTEASTPQVVASLQAGDTRIISPHVKRFQLAAGMRNKEPRGVLADVNDHNSADGVLTVYVFSEVINMKDSRIHYRWLRNGKPAANVNIGVWSNKWRSHSSKYITLGMRGDWQVRLEDSSGELLAEASFHY